MNKEQHPAQVFGSWLKARRLTRGIIARIFAGQIWLSPSKYAEVELGVVKWVGENQKAIIPMLLKLTHVELAKFHKLLAAAKSAAALTFENIFKRDDLKPVRAAHCQLKQFTLEEESALLDLVFRPLTA
jgi:hypothetical protein